MIPSKKQITTSLIRLHRCAGWSAPLLFASTEDKFSRVEAHFIFGQAHKILECITLTINIYLNKHAQLHSEAMCPNFAHMGEVFKIIAEFGISVESQP